MAHHCASVTPPPPPSPSPAQTTTQIRRVLPYRLPPSPADTEKAESDSASAYSQADGAGSTAESTAESSQQRPYPLPPPSIQSKVLSEDLKTPDRHVERDPRLIRLTGVHPFNVEAPLSALYDEGFLTTKNLHFVRNHGAVPEVRDDETLDWQFSVEGLVANPVTMTVRQLLADYEQFTYPITLICAGNRRKEQNIVRKTKGFSWGAGGLSTAIWTGVPLHHLLERAKPRRGARFVCMEGADKLPNGYYGTSVRLSWAKDPERGILLAHKMNGEPLPADHGRPLRMVVPGQIGGRSVKWLKRIIVTAEPSDSWYHIYDNRVLPTSISPDESANMPDVWRDERYAIYDINVNSVICVPAHGERLPIVSGRSESPDSYYYTVRGYGYAGGGKRVTRVELTLDKAKTWRLANVEYPEDSYRLAAEGERLYGGRVDSVAERETCFCWCFWHLDISVADLAAADDIMVRCMDDSMMTQPRDMYWSVLGMLSNSWFRVVVHREEADENGSCLRFEHPAPPKMAEQGWMERVKKAGGNLTNGFWGEKMGGEGEGEDADGDTAAHAEPAKEICMTDEKKMDHIISLDELRKHESEDEPWFVVNGHVYDGTRFLEGHPGGATSITAAAAQDVSEEFLAIHSENAKAMMPGYHVGVLDKAAVDQLGSSDPTEASEAVRPVFLQSKAWSRAVITAKTPVSSDSTIFSFRLEHADQRVGLPIGQHLMMRVRDPVTREAIMRAYTPLSMDLPGAPSRGVLDVLIKIYLDAPGRPGGRMTKALNAMPVGHPVDFKGPIGHFEYNGGGHCTIGSGRGARRRHVRRFVMVCGGSGITPVFQVLRAVLAVSASEDPTQCVLLDGNRTEEDILCRAELDALAAAHPDRFRAVYVLSKAAEGWTGQRGRMDAAFFQREVGAPPPTAADTDTSELVLVCGPGPMETSVRQVFADMGWRKEDLHFF